MNTIYAELACAFTGTDDRALAAWLETAVRQRNPEVALRCEAYWNAASEDEQTKVGAYIGLAEPEAKDASLRRAVVADFGQLAEIAGQLLDD
jgi:hypothetical protein